MRRSMTPEASPQLAKFRPLTMTEAPTSQWDWPSTEHWISGDLAMVTRQ